MTFNDLYEAAEKKNLSGLITEMFSNGTLENELPELYVLSKLIHNPIFHPEGDPLQHTIKAIEVGEKQGYSALTLLCVLFHDIGKGFFNDSYWMNNGSKEDRETVKDEYGLGPEEVYPYHIFPQHDRIGVHLFEQMVENHKWNISKDDLNTIVNCIRYHQYLRKIDNIKRPFKIAKLVYSKIWNTIKEVYYCDILCRGGFYDITQYHKAIEMAESFPGIEKFKNIYKDENTIYDEYGIAQSR